MKTTAIILSGGVGSRMKSNIPKQYLKIHGKTLLYYTIAAFAKAAVDDIVIVCGNGDEELVRDIAGSAAGGKQITVTVGGKERFDSVYNGLVCCKDSDYVLIHDGARCCITTELIDRIIADRKNCITAVPVKDTIKMAEDGVVSRTLPRSLLYSVQTPQAFFYNDIMAAHNKFRKAIELQLPESEGITDDSMIMERFSDKKVYIVEGEDTNLKVTTPSDLEIVEKILEKNFLKKI